jgi:hypothetical protein
LAILFSVLLLIYLVCGNGKKQKKLDGKISQSKKNGKTD